MNILKSKIYKKLFSRNAKSNISYIEAKELYNNNNGIIIDVRNRDEYDEKHLSNAINIPLYEIDDIIERQVPDKNKIIMLYCKTGKRSKLARKILIEKGYTNVYTINIKM